MNETFSVIVSLLFGDGGRHDNNLSDSVDLCIDRFYFEELELFSFEVTTRTTLKFEMLLQILGQLYISITNVLLRRNA